MQSLLMSCFHSGQKGHRHWILRPIVSLQVASPLMLPLEHRSLVHSAHHCISTGKTQTEMEDFISIETCLAHILASAPGIKSYILLGRHFHIMEKYPLVSLHNFQSLNNENNAHQAASAKFCHLSLLKKLSVIQNSRWQEDT